MTYPEQLETIQWKNRRLEILKRDAHKCQNCSNEKVISELDSGFFTSYCFPDSKEAIHIDHFGTERGMRSGIKKGYSKYLTKSSIVYYKEIPKWRRMVFGIRKLNSEEKSIFEKFDLEILNAHKKIKNTFRNYEKPIDVSEVINLEEKRRIKFTELSKQNKKHDYEWLFMLGLHIHHKYYVKNLFAWEYKDDALITLCETCHENLHKDKTIEVYNDEHELIGHYKYCIRCHGAGVFPEYSHVKNGICFRCNGLRYEELITNVGT
jgi:5-methylcytosine-specific restriction endonuclease McrA